MWPSVSRLLSLGTETRLKDLASLSRSIPEGEGMSGNEIALFAVIVVAVFSLLFGFVMNRRREQ
jgi:hypothetical protein